MSDKLIAYKIEKIVKAYESYTDIVCNKKNQWEIIPLFPEELEISYWFFLYFQKICF